MVMILTHTMVATTALSSTVGTAMEVHQAHLLDAMNLLQMAWTLVLSIAITSITEHSMAVQVVL
jgi:hypothetical protein